MDQSPSSPYHVLTSSYDRNTQSSNQTSMLDLELMHHFMTDHVEIMTDSFDVAAVWHVELPRIGFRFPYVNHALLGFSALHLATQDSTRSHMLRASAVVHLDQALMLYRQESAGPVTAENANARFAFTWLVALFMYAVPPSVPPIDALVEVFSLVKGVETVLQQTLPWVAQGPLAPMVARAYMEDVGLMDPGMTSIAPTAFPSEGVTRIHSIHANLPEGMEYGLGHLDFMIGMHNMLPDDRRVCVLMLGDLKAAYSAVVNAQGTCTIATSICFPTCDPTSFQALLKQRYPQALVILAHYAVLMDIWDSRWWIHGWGKRVLRDIVGALSDEWKTWIEWPVQIVLMKSTPQPSLSPELSMEPMMM